MKKTLGAVAAAAAIAISLSACGGSAPASTEAKGEINYWLWDANQLPAYQQCANDFTKANPDITVKITQRGWDDYWTTLTNGFVAGTAPDVFTNHLSKYPEYAAKKQLLSLDEAVAKDGIKLESYTKGLPELWVGQDGKRYGLPKDWDTVGLFYNTAMTDSAGLTAEQMANLDWNPQDGGSYEKAIAHLSVDKKGVRGDEAGFDKNNVAVYGLGLAGSGSGQGQTEWSFLSATTGWNATDKNPWGTKFNYDDPKFQETIAWWAGLTEKGYMPKLETTVGASLADNFGAGKAAINTTGDWLIGQYQSYKGVKTAFAPTPKGPEGKRASMFNGLADSIWVGSDNKPAAAKWVEYLGSPDCQNIVGEKGVVFPAIPAATDKATAAFKAKDVDVAAFMVHLQDKTTFLFPITDYASQIDGIMHPAMDAVANGKDPATLTEANNEVNTLFG